MRDVACDGDGRLTWRWSDMEGTVTGSYCFIIVEHIETTDSRCRLLSVIAQLAHQPRLGAVLVVSAGH